MVLVEVPGAILSSFLAYLEPELLDQNEGIIFIINPFPVTPADFLDAANLVLTLRIRNKTEKDDPSTSKPVTSVEVNLINLISKKAQSKKNHHTLIVGSHIKARLLSFLFRDPSLIPDSFKNAFSFFCFSAALFHHSLPR